VSSPKSDSPEIQTETLPTTDNGRIAVAEALRSSTSVKAGRNGPASLGCLPAPSWTLEGLGPLPRSWQVRRTSGRERRTWRGGASRLESSLALWRCPAAQGDPEKGEKVFNKCKPCHVADEEKNKIGPTLVGIFGRPAGSVEDFKYSDAMKESGVTWDEETVAAYIADPKVTSRAIRWPSLASRRNRTSPT
jgi:cytochrome c